MSGTTTAVNAGVGSASRPTTAEAGDNMKLGTDDFLKLFVAQLRQQDPINPVGDKEFIGQIAQLTSVEQLTKMSGSLDRVDYGNQVTQAVGLLGKTITWDDGEGFSGEGLADSLAFDADGGIVLRVAGQDVKPGIVKAVR
ncbi:MAG: flagellar hook capping FlgD N-terminal domain-containing protein [Gaiellales bacterium]